MVELWLPKHLLWPIWLNNKCPWCIPFCILLILIDQTIWTKSIWYNIWYLSSKEGSLFILFVHHVKISQPPTMLLVLLQSPCWVGVHQDGFVMFRHTKQELLNIEPFCHWKFNKIINTNFWRNWGAFLVSLESPPWVG